ncbi:MAG TPA: hypothetical protein VHP38_15300 [Ruminiclostridium sp.]|nr:hypothetical protein [Ruminiclostridium sp.]
MSKNDEHHVRVEAGQILNPECFPLPNELVCIQVPKVFDQVALRECMHRSFTVYTGGQPLPDVDFLGATNFDITNVKVLKSEESLTKAGFKKLKIAVTISYDVTYSVGGVQRTVTDTPTFVLTINDIYCPACTTQIGLTGFHQAPNFTADLDGSLIKVEAIADAFNDMFITTHHDNSCQNIVLTLDLGAFFIVKCECIVQLLVPAYGYCPVPPEQQNAAALDCTTFNDRTRTPFPTRFFPDQKWNPLDRPTRED